MKKLVLVAGCGLLLLSSCIISKHSNMSFVKNRHIDKEAEVMAVSVSTILARPIIKKALSEEGEDIALQKLLTKIGGVKVLTVENQGDFKAINSNVKKYLDRKNYEEWMTINSDEDFVVFHVKMKKEKIKRLFLTVTSDDGDGVFVRLKGKFPVDGIADSFDELSLSGIRLKDKFSMQDSLQEASK
ncbi:MAG: DUF4252 domain-containing protein [Bacteroidota bacterium]